MQMVGYLSLGFTLSKLGYHIRFDSFGHISLDLVPIGRCIELEQIIGYESELGNLSTFLDNFFL